VGVSALLPPSTAPMILAHQGGWDEFLLIAGPMLAVAGVLWLAKRRVDAAHEERRETGESVLPDAPAAPSGSPHDM
jgi:cyanate permease